MMSTSPWTWAGMLISLALVWVLAAALIRLLLGRPVPTSQTTPEEPLAILDRRLATGEITIEQYHQLRQALTTGHTAR